MNGAGGVLALFLIIWTAGWAGAAAWNQTWKVITRGHFRITAWMIAILGVLAVLANQSAVPDRAGAQPGLVAAVAAAGIVYLAAQYLESDLPGAIAGGLVAVFGGAALVWSGTLVQGWNGALAGLSLVAAAVFFGAVTNGMMLGHWYLNQPGLKPWALARLTQLAIAGLALSGLVGLATAGRLMDAETEGAVLGLPGFGENFGTAFFAIWVVLLVFTGVVIGAARRCINIRSIQSATGLYYVAILTAGVCVFLQLYLMLNSA